MLAVIFDMDGVLTDSEPVINAAAIAGLAEFGVKARPEDFAPFVGMGEDRYIGGVAESHGHAYRPEMKQRVYEIYLDLAPHQVSAFPGAVDLVRLLAGRGVPLALASSADRIKIAANLNAIGLAPALFGAVIAAEDVSARKPAPDIFLAAARALGVPPSGCCVVEDALSGIQAALAAGMRCVAVAQTFDAARLAAAGAHLVRATIGAVSAADLGVSGARQPSAVGQPLPRAGQEPRRQGV